jgi:hypothetical protein
MNEPDEKEVVRQAMSIIGRARSPRKIEAARETAAARRGKPLSEAHKAKLRDAQAARRERERAAAGPSEPKRPRGRPRKSDAQSAAPDARKPENGK